MRPRRPRRSPARPAPKLCLEVRGGGEVAALAVAAGERLVGDAADEVLEEAVLAALGRARVGLDAEDLLPYEASQERVELGLGEAGERGERLLGEGLAEHGGVLQEAPLLGGEAVEPGGDQALQRLGYLELFDRRPWPVDAALLDEQARGRGACGPSRPRTAVRPPRGRGSRSRSSSGSPGTKPSRRVSHRRLREGCERERRLVASHARTRGGAAGSSGRARQSTKIGWLRDHSSRYPMNSTSAASAHCRSSKRSTTGLSLGHALEEEAPGAEELLLAPRRRPPRARAGAAAAARRSRRSSSSGTYSSTDARRLLGGGGGLLALGDPRAHPHHLGERPVRDAFPVGEAAPAVPPDGVLRGRRCT